MKALILAAVASIILLISTYGSPASAADADRYILLLSYDGGTQWEIVGISALDACQYTGTNAQSEYSLHRATNAVCIPFVPNHQIWLRAGSKLIQVQR